MRRRRAFAHGAITLSGQASKPVRPTRRFVTPPRGSGPGTTLPLPPGRNPRRVSRGPGLAMIRFRSPLLTEYPFLQVLRCFTSLRTPRTNAVTPHDGCRVPPFGNPRIEACLAAPRGISLPAASFIGPMRQGIHR